MISRAAAVAAAVILEGGLKCTGYLAIGRTAVGNFFRVKDILVPVKNDRRYGLAGFIVAQCNRPQFFSLNFSSMEPGGSGSNRNDLLSSSSTVSSQ